MKTDKKDLIRNALAEKANQIMDKIKVGEQFQNACFKLFGSSDGKTISAMSYLEQCEGPFGSNFKKLAKSIRKEMIKFERLFKLIYRFDINSISKEVEKRVKILCDYIKDETEKMEGLTADYERKITDIFKERCDKENVEVSIHRLTTTANGYKYERPNNCHRGSDIPGVRIIVQGISEQYLKKHLNELDTELLVDGNYYFGGSDHDSKSFRDKLMNMYKNISKKSEILSGQSLIGSHLTKDERKYFESESAHDKYFGSEYGLSSYRAIKKQCYDYKENKNCKKSDNSWDKAKVRFCELADSLIYKEEIYEEIFSKLFKFYHLEPMSYDYMIEKKDPFTLYIDSYTSAIANV